MVVSRNRLAAGSLVAIMSLIGAGCAPYASPPIPVDAITVEPNVETTDSTPKTSRTNSEDQTDSNCDSNYSGCVPIASDVDCQGGSGNGPAYARGPVQVIGYDIYDLDRDGDGVACE